MTEYDQSINAEEEFFEHLISKTTAGYRNRPEGIRDIWYDGRPLTKNQATWLRNNANWKHIRIPQTIADAISVQIGKDKAAIKNGREVVSVFTKTEKLDALAASIESLAEAVLKINETLIQMRKE